MKKIAKMISLLLAGVMVLAMLTACSGGVVGGKVYGTIRENSSDQPNVNGMTITRCSVIVTDSDTIGGSYAGKEIVCITYRIKNDSKQPLDMEYTIGELFSNGGGEAGYDALFGKGSKYFKAAVDGKSASVFSYGLKTNPDSCEAKLVSVGNGAGVQLWVLAPIGWRNVTVQWSPSCGNGKSVNFRFTPNDVSKK